jgi:nucleotide-binding universal stress UspA family protein
VARPMFQRLLLAWDGSPPAQRALDVAVGIARRYGGEIVAVSVAHSPTHAETEEDRLESVDAARRYLERSFARVRDRADRAGVEIEHVVVEGDQPADDLIRYAHDRDFDLVVAGRHRGRRSPGRLVLHGLADRLVSHSDVPVLIVGDHAAD